MVIKSCWMMENGIVAPRNELPRTSPMKRGVSVSIVQVRHTRHQPIMISCWLELGGQVSHIDMYVVHAGDDDRTDQEA